MHSFIPTLTVAQHLPYKEVFEKKSQAKMKLLGLSQSPKKAAPLVVAILFAEEKPSLFSLSADVVEAMLHSDLQIVPCLSKEQHDLVIQHSALDSSVIFAPANELLLAADVFLVLGSSHREVVHMQISAIKDWGGVPLLFASDWQNEFELYNPLTEQGSTFLFQSYTCWSIFSQLVRIHEVFHFPYDWNTIRKRAMKLHSQEKTSMDPPSTYAYLS